MDYSSYEKETVSKLDIIGSYIVDLYYNRLYNKAIALKEKSGNSITESYRYVLSTYITHIDTVDFYKTFLHGVYFYTTVSTKYQNMSHKQCLDFFVREFIPTQYLNSMTEIQKNNIMFMVLKNTLAQFTDTVLTKYMSMIIDEHLDTDNITVLQDEFLKLLLMERDRSYDQFIHTERKIDEVKDDRKNTFLLKNELHTKKKLVLAIEQKNKQIGAITSHYKKCVGEFKSYKEKFDKMKSINKELKNMINEQIQSFKILQDEYDRNTLLNHKLETENKKLTEEIESIRHRSSIDKESIRDTNPIVLATESPIKDTFKSKMSKPSIYDMEEDSELDTLSEFDTVPTTQYISDEDI